MHPLIKHRLQGEDKKPATIGDVKTIPKTGVWRRLHRQDGTPIVSGTNPVGGAAFTLYTIPTLFDLLYGEFLIAIWTEVTTPFIGANNFGMSVQGRTRLKLGPSSYTSQGLVPTPVSLSSYTTSVADLISQTRYILRFRTLKSGVIGGEASSSVPSVFTAKIPINTTTAHWQQVVTAPSSINLLITNQPTGVIPEIPYATDEWYDASAANREAEIELSIRAISNRTDQIFKVYRIELWYAPSSIETP